MKTLLLSTIAAAALSLTVSTGAQAKDIAAEAFANVQPKTENSISQAGCYYRYYWVSNGYRYVYRYWYVCY